jgi:hypothetical protein
MREKRSLYAETGQNGAKQGTERYRNTTENLEKTNKRVSIEPARVV